MPAGQYTQAREAANNPSHALLSPCRGFGLLQNGFYRRLQLRNGWWPVRAVRPALKEKTGNAVARNTIRKSRLIWPRHPMTSAVLRTDQSMNFVKGAIIVGSWSWTHSSIEQRHELPDDVTRKDGHCNVAVPPRHRGEGDLSSKQTSLADWLRRNICITSGIGMHQIACSVND
jgi:hypothetical protein